MTARRTVLLVEDDSLIRIALGKLLRDEGYKVVEAEDGQQAIELLRTHRSSSDAVELVILDMMLPKSNGLAVLQTLADLGSYIPIVAMSADREQLRRVVSTTASETLPQPFDLARLLAVVKRNCG